MNNKPDMTGTPIRDRPEYAEAMNPTMKPCSHENCPIQNHMVTRDEPTWYDEPQHPADADQYLVDTVFQNNDYAMWVLPLDEATAMLATRVIDPDVKSVTVSRVKREGFEDGREDRDGS